MTCYECIRQAYEEEKMKEEKNKENKTEPTDNKMIIKTNVSAQELFELLEGMQRFYIKGLGTDREILAGFIINRIMDADDKEKEYSYYNKIMLDLRRVLDSRKDIMQETKKQ
jgi:hypothetical protein